MANMHSFYNSKINHILKDLSGRPSVQFAILFVLKVKVLVTRLLCPWNSPGKNTGLGSHSFLEGIFLTQGSNSGLLHSRQILYHLSHQGNPLCWAVGKMDGSAGKPSGFALVLLKSSVLQAGFQAPFFCCKKKVGTKWLSKLASLESVSGQLTVCAQSCSTFCDPVDYSPPGSSAMESSKQEYWSMLPFPTLGDLPDPGIELVSHVSPALSGKFFTNCSTWEAQIT